MDQVLEARKGSILLFLSKNQLLRPDTAWPMQIMVEKSIFDNIWIKILFHFPLTCSVGPEVVLGEPE